MTDDQAARLKAVAQEHESFLFFGMIRVIDQAGAIVQKNGPCFVERNAVPGHVGPSLTAVPGKLNIAHSIILAISDAQRNCFGKTVVSGAVFRHSESGRVEQVGDGLNSDTLIWFGAPDDFPTMNRLYYGDNLTVLRGSIDDESVDLIYLDPPFNSQATYNVLFRSTAGEKSRAQIEAFEDTWHWGDEAELAFDGVMTSGKTDAAEMLRAMRTFLRENDMMAYLSMMAVRLLELHRVLKQTGSLYLHCDPTASHYLKILMDAVFGAVNFKTEIVWKRTSSHGNVSSGYGDVTDTILYFSRGDKPNWNQIYVPYSQKHIDTKFTFKDADGRAFTTSDMRNPGVRPNLMYEYKGYKPHPNGWAISRKKMEKYDKEGQLWFPPDKSGRIRLKRYLDEQPGQKIQNLWDDISPINSQAQERLGYPTQKPQALLERILLASSTEGE